VKLVGGAQAERWRSDFGRAYTDRNEMDLQQMDALYRGRYGRSRTDLNRLFLDDLPRAMRILEVGANLGNQLLCLRKMGFTRLVGIDLQSDALLRLPSRDRTVAPVLAAGQSLPFAEDAFDLVFTSGLLIHIPPDAVRRVLSEIYRCARSYIWGLEYYADTYTSVEYRGQLGMMWKTDFATLYLDAFPDLEIARKERLRYREEPLEDEMFLLRKRAAQIRTPSHSSGPQT